MSTSKKAPQSPRPDRRTCTRIAGHAGVDVRTVQRALSGQTRPNPLTVEAIQKACAALGVSVS
jgi:DNA-binding LacI/PurR family transcriptional regulator